MSAFREKSAAAAGRGFTRSCPALQLALLLAIFTAIIVVGNQTARAPLKAVAACRSLYPIGKRVERSSVTNDGVPAWRLPPKVRDKIVAIFPVGSSTPATEEWVRMSRGWRRGIPAIVGSFDPIRSENEADAARHGETWVQWNKTPGTKYPAKPFMNLVVMTLGLAADVLNEKGGFDWVVFGDDDTYFNLDVIADMIERFDQNMPHLLTDNIFYRYETNSSVHGTPLAPRCTPCGVEAPPVKQLGGWKPPQACPVCTWDLLRESDPKRPAFYSKDGFKPVYLKNYELSLHGGAGMVLSRGLVAMLNSSYMHDCMTTKFKGVIVPGGDTIISHCMFMLNVAPTDPGSLASTGKQTFAPNDCQTICAVSDSYLYTKGFGCCDKDCQQRLRTIASIHVRSMHFAAPVQAKESLQMLTRARDMYLLARDLDASGRATHTRGGWDRDSVCL